MNVQRDTTPPPSRPCLTTEHCERWGWCMTCTPKLAQAEEHVLAAMTAAGVPAEWWDDVQAKMMLLLDATTVPMPRKMRP
jgi:hypothetical protein